MGCDPADFHSDHLQKGLQGEVAETPKPGDARLSHVTTRLVATANRVLELRGLSLLLPVFDPFSWVTR